VSGIAEAISVLLSLFFTNTGISTGPAFTLQWGFALGIAMNLFVINNKMLLICLHISAIVGLNMVWGGLADVLLGYADAVDYKKTLSFAIAGQLTGAAIGGSVIGVMLYAWEVRAGFKGGL
jgi:hypothetical protein